MLTKNGFEYVILGQGDEWYGFGTKIIKCLEYYKKLGPERIIIQLDARDVLVNQNYAYFSELLRNFNSIISDKLIVSTEIGCCVYPMIISNSFFEDKTFSRNSRAYHSFGLPFYRNKWISMFDDANESRANKLNAGMILGRVKNFVKVYELLGIDKYEDDQALLSDLLFKTNYIYLDYDNIFFANSYSSMINGNNGGNDNCFEEKDGKWYNPDTGSVPVFIQTPGKNWTCYDKLYTLINNNNNK
jgi:hypothetical protein